MTQNSPRFDFTPFQKEILPNWIEQFISGTSYGEYSFEKGGPTSLYGTTDILIMKYILGDLDSVSEGEKNNWASLINQFQDPTTGHFKKYYTKHHQEHTTAYAVAALHLIDRKPLFPMAWKAAILQSKEKMEQWIESINWKDIWPSSHIIAGVPSALALTEEGPEHFFKWYFNFLDGLVDPLSGYWRRGDGIQAARLKQKIRSPKQADLGGAFHLFFMYEKFNRKWLYPSQVVDSTLKLQRRSGFWGLGTTSFIDLDALYSLFRSSRNAFDYRRHDIEKAAIKYLKPAEKLLNNPKRVFAYYRNTHGLVGAIAAIAECQKFCPEFVNTPTPWRQSLDKACFI